MVQNYHETLSYSKGSGVKIIILLTVLLNSLICLANPVLRLDTSLAPPYQIQIDGLLKGSAVAVLDCALAKLDVRYVTDIVPWRRAQSNLRNGQSDGFFSTMPLPEIEPYGRLSAPLILEKWFWFSLRPELLQRADFPATLRIGVVRGSNQEGWLQEQNIRVAQLVNQLPSLLRLLLIGRVDTVLIDQQAMQQLQAQHPEAIAQPLASRFERYAPLGVYFSNHLLAQQPGFLSRFNAAVPRCHVPGLTLESSEQQKLLQMANSDAALWLQDPQLLSSLSSLDAQHQHLAQEAILKLDSQWQAAVQQGQTFEWMQAILASPLSSLLNKWQQASRGRYTELFVTDSQGVLVATSRVTTDYWQGDEEKFIQPMKLNLPGLPHPQGWLDQGSGGGQTQVGYDDSTRQFLSHISFLIRSKGGSQPLGVLTLGVNVEKALRD